MRTKRTLRFSQRPFYVHHDVTKMSRDFSEFTGYNEAKEEIFNIIRREHR